tara:strand:+ start:2100 stop:2282 length:183 start_codon:yes stop_codon:yes gene_type:complete
MTPQELYEKTKSILEEETKKAQQMQNEIQVKQQEFNNLSMSIIGNQKLFESLKDVEGVSD